MFFALCKKIALRIYTRKREVIMKKLILGALLVVLLAMLTHPILANSETVFTHDAIITGGGIITEGHGKDAPKITFGVDVFIKYFVNENGEPADESGVPIDPTWPLVFAEPPIGDFHINFHNTSNDNLDKGKFTTTDIYAVAIHPGSYQDPDGKDTHLFARIEANGKFNGEDGWSIVVRFTDFGAPGKVKDANPDTAADAIRVMLFESGELVYDTAALDGDYPREQSWRTLLDGGNVVVYYQR